MICVEWCVEGGEGGMMEGWWGDDGRGRGRGGVRVGGGFGVRVRG